MKNKQFIICAVIIVVLCICNFIIPNISIPCFIAQIITMLWMMVLGIKDDLKKADTKKDLAQKL